MTTIDARVGELLEAVKVDPRLDGSDEELRLTYTTLRDTYGDRQHGPIVPHIAFAGTITIVNGMVMMGVWRPAS
jgi:hypothetical protein